MAQPAIRVDVSTVCEDESSKDPSGMHEAKNNSNENDPYKEVARSSLKLKKRDKFFKKKKREKVDLKNIDITIRKEGDTASNNKTLAEISFEKRQLQNQFGRLMKKASVSHREKVEKFNQQMTDLTEFNDIPKVSWTK